MSNSRVLFEFRGDASNIKKSLNELDERLVHTSEKAENIGQSFNQAGKMSKQSGKMMAAGSAQATTAITGLNWIISDTPYFFQNTRMGIMAVSNNITPLVNNMAYLQKETGNMKNAFKALGKQLVGPMGIVFAITTAIAVVQALSFVIGKHKRKTEGATESNKEFAKSLEEINKSVNIDALESQIDNSVKLTQATEQVIADKKELLEIDHQELESLEEKQGLIESNEKRLAQLRTTKLNAQTPEAEASIQRQIEGLSTYIAGLRDENDNLDKNIKKKKETVKATEKEIEQAESLLEQQSELQKNINQRLELLKKAGIESRKEARYEEKLFELKTEQLPVEEQIAAWKKRKAEYAKNASEEEKASVDYKEKILDYDQKIQKLSEEKIKIETEIANLKNEQLSKDERIAVLTEKLNEIDQSNLQGLKEALVIKGEISKIQAESDKAREAAIKKYRQLQSGVDTESRRYLAKKIAVIQQEIAATEEGTERKKELEKELYEFKAQLLEKEQEVKEDMLRKEQIYQKRLSQTVAKGGLESVYEEMFSNIKQKVIEYWLQKLGITRAMMNMEKMIIMLGEGNIQSIRDIFHQREMSRKAVETGASATAAGVKATESAAAIPFPGNIAAIAMVLASVFSAIRKSKINGQKVVAAAEGAIINKPTLLLAGEALSRSGTEIVMPEKNFNRYMDEKVLPGIMAKVNINSKGTEQRLDRVEKAIYTIGYRIPGETGKAVKRALRGKF
ncbi:MAG: hypothetical protein U5N26_07040 [Candidatus Marinimicrobia bacterium]|nr:hypothetical protein [Candidatus Neomarinimicrobiota bacterium]